MKKVLILFIVFPVISLVVNGITQEAKKAAAQNFNYVGAVKCKICHKGETKGNIFEIWEKSSHANAYTTLATAKAKDIAKQTGVQGDPQQVKECLSCHVTGYDAAVDRKEANLTMEEGVSCEACHGPGSEYKALKVMKGIHAKTVSGAEFGLIKPDRTVCVKCHNTKSPTYKEFKFEEAVKRIAHPLPKKT